MLKLPTARKESGDSYFTIGWNDLREIVKEALTNRRVAGLEIAANREQIQAHTTGVGRGFYGYTPAQLLSWVNDGFQTEILDSLDDTKPIREKRRYRYVEEGEEIHVDRALSGEDNFMSDWTKRESIPGAAVEAEVMFSAGTSSDIVNAYNVWLCRAISSLEAAGIDTQLTLKFSSQDCFNGAGDGHTIVRVKSENEDLDFASFSAILSPACLRTFGFVAICLHAESAGKPASGSLGRGRYNVKPTPDWGVNFNSKRGVLEVNCPYQPKSFPAERMDSALKSAIKDMK
jgi:hypothetical protein